MFIELRNLFADESGATAIEYTMILALIFLALTAGAEAMSISLASIFDYVSTSVSNSMPKGWLLHLWLPLANPLGIFTPRHPGTDYIDLHGKAFPYCNG